MRLIDADALLNDPSNISANEFGDDVVYVEDIKKAPTVELPHGEWIVDKIFGTVRCPKCFCEIVPNNMLHGKANFCPNCGSDNRNEGRKNE